MSADDWEGGGGGGVLWEVGCDRESLPVVLKGLRLSECKWLEMLGAPVAGECFAGGAGHRGGGMAGGGIV